MSARRSRRSTKTDKDVSLSVLGKELTDVFQLTIWILTVRNKLAWCLHKLKLNGDQIERILCNLIGELHFWIFFTLQLVFWFIAKT